MFVGLVLPNVLRTMEDTWERGKDLLALRGALRVTASVAFPTDVLESFTEIWPARSFSALGVSVTVALLSVASFNAATLPIRRILTGLFSWASVSSVKKLFVLGLRRNCCTAARVSSFHSKPTLH